MRESPRTWPSIRLSRLRHGALIPVRIVRIYPPRVWAASRAETKVVAMPNPLEADASRGMSHDHAAHATGGRETPAGATATDPVCGMSVDPHTTAHRHEHRGRTHYFCSAGCRAKFEADPAKYLE